MQEDNSLGLFKKAESLYRAHPLKASHRFVEICSGAIVKILLESAVVEFEFNKA